MSHRLITLLIGTTLSVATVGRVFADKNFYSIEKEQALGRQLARDVERQATMVRDPLVAACLNRLGANLARQSATRCPITIKVIASGDVNAFALPGGFIFVNSGLIQQADNEAELAGVIAHCVGHVAARHGTREVTHGEIAQIGMVPLYFVDGWAGYSAYQAATILIPESFLKYSRALVAEADRLGLDYMYKAGYDPAGFVAMLEKVQVMEKRKPPTAAFSTHPPTAERIAVAEDRIRQFRTRPRYLVSTSEFESVRAQLPAPRTPQKNPPTLMRRADD